MHPAAQLLFRFLASLAPGPLPRVEKLPEPDALERLWERNKPLALLVMAILVMFAAIGLWLAACIFLPETTLAR